MKHPAGFKHSHAVEELEQRLWQRPGKYLVSQIEVSGEEAELETFFMIANKDILSSRNA